MRRRLAIFCIIFTLFCVGNAQAEIYTCKDAKGNTVYTDTPGGCANAEEVKVDTLPELVPSKSIAIPSSNRVVKEEDKSVYSELVITSPSNDATIRENQGNLTINFRASPALQTRIGHKFVVSMDGTEIYSGTSTITALKNVDRGTHTIVVKIVAPDGSTKLSAAPVKFTMQRFSVLNNAESNSTDANAGGEDGSQTTVTNQKFPGNTKFNRPASPPPVTPPPPPPASGINN